MSDQFQLLDKLGSGGMGDVYRARDTRLNRIVAVKVLSAASHGDELVRQRFFQEAQAASALNHPNIITIHDVVSDGGKDLIVMECVNGKTLADLIPKGGLRVPQIINYGLQITDGLGAAHNVGIVHRDLKPGNIMVTDRGIVKILDFGLAKLLDRHREGDDAVVTRDGGPLTVQGAIMGTVAYMSPEQAQGSKVDARSDIFSFGAVLYEMATGQRAFDGSSMLSTLTAVLRDEARPIFELAPDVPVALEQLIQRCLRKNPDDRWRSMAEVHERLLELKEVSDSGTLYRSLVPPPLPLPRPPVTGPPEVTPPPPVTWQGPPRLPPPAAKKSQWPIVAGLLSLMLIGAGVMLLLWFRHKQPPIATTPPTIVPAVQPVTADSVLRNSNILEMVRAKVPTSVIISQIQSSKTDFNLSSSEIILLVQGGVPETVIEAMRNPTPVPQTPSNIPPPQTPKQSPSSSPPLPTATASHAPLPAATASPAPPSPAAASPAAASPAPPPPAPGTVESGAAVTVADGTQMLLSLTDDVPGDAAEGAALHFAVTSDLKVKGIVVIRKGAGASGVVVDEMKKRKFFGGGTRLTFRLQTVESVDGKQLRIRATPAFTSGDAAKRPLESKKSKAPGIAAAKGTECPAYVDGDAVVNVRP